MNFATLSLKRPVFIASIVILMIVAGFVSLRSLPVDLYPNVEIPYVVVVTEYPGAGPKEVETVITKPLEEELVSLEGVKKMKSTSQDSMSMVEIEFKMGLAVDTLEQKVRDRVALAAQKFPKAVKNSYIQKYDPSSSPVLTITARAPHMPLTHLTDWVERQLKPQISQVPKVGKLNIIGGRDREIHVLLDPKKLDEYRIPLVTVSEELGRSGENIPGGTIKRGEHELSVRNLGEFASIESILNRLISFAGGEAPVRVKDLGTAEEGASRELSRSFHNGESVIMIEVLRQAGANVIEVTDNLKKRVEEVSKELEAQKSEIKLSVVRDGAKEIRDNVYDVQETIIIGIILTVVVVFFFLGSFRSTIITGLALPNSLLGAFILLYFFGFSINIMTLLALSLAVGLLVDDAIVVRENIFKHVEVGKSPIRAALDGTNEVRMAVIATTFAILAVFGPVGFMQGLIGQYFKEFGLAVCFAMLISLFDALTIAPMLSAYWVAKKKEAPGFLERVSAPLFGLAKKFDELQGWLEKVYKRFLQRTLGHPFKTLGAGLLVCFLLGSLVTVLPTTFIPQGEMSELTVAIELPAGLNLDKTQEVVDILQDELKKVDGIRDILSSVGTSLGEINIANIYTVLKKPTERKLKSTELREVFRKIIAEKEHLFPEGTLVRVNMGGAESWGMPFELTILANSHEDIRKYGDLIFNKLKQEKYLMDLQSSMKPGKPELVVKVNPAKAQRVGISEALVGSEIRGRIEGIESARYREEGQEYDIRVMIKDGDKNFLESLNEILVPNINLLPVKMSEFVDITEAEGDNKLTRTNRSASMKLSANILPGEGLGEVVAKTKKVITSLNIPSNVRILFEGEAENLDEMGGSMVLAFMFGILLIYLVLASLYESFFVPIIVMSALPLAVVGAFLSLFIAGQGLDMYSMIGMLLLMGVATKNSILLVDTILEFLREHKGQNISFASLVTDACERRLRPILMTSLALVAGMVPIAVGLNEASAQRTSLGTAVIGGTISSTLLTLVLVPAIVMLVRKRMEKAAYSFADRIKAVDEISSEGLKE